MSDPEEQPIPNEEQAQGLAPNVQEVSGGQHGQTYMGPQYITTQVNKTFHPVGGSGKPQKPGFFQVSCLISIREKDPISLSSRIFHGLLHSDVTGDRKVAVKITAAEKRNYREAKIYFSVPHHKNIVERIATDTFNFRGQPSIFIAMELCDCNLYDYVKSEAREEVPFDSEKYTRINYQILEGLDCLHVHKVVHGDLKPSNVLIILNGMIVKLSDFGLSRSLRDGHDSTQITSPQGGTSGWLAPEILDGTTQISKASDIFPCGLVFHFTWSHGKHAYGDRALSRNHYILEGTNQDLSRMLINFMDEATTLMERMFQRNPAGRPTAREILQSPIFQRFGIQPARVDNSQVAEIFAQALTMMDPRETRPANSNENPLTITPNQLQTAMKSFFERNRDRVVRIVAAQSGVGGNPEATSPKQLYAQPSRQAVRNPMPIDSGSQSTPTHPVATTTSTTTLAPQSISSRSQTHRSSTPPSGGARHRIDRTLLSINPAQSGVHRVNPEATTSPKQLHTPDEEPGILLPRAPRCVACNLLLLSCFEEDRGLLVQLELQISPSFSMRESEFMFCDQSSDPQMIQERLWNMPFCSDGITTIIFVVETAIAPLNEALDQNNLRISLQRKELSSENLDRRIHDIRKNLAVFALSPAGGEISRHSAKIAVNVKLTKDKSPEKIPSTKIVLENDAISIKYSNRRFEGYRPSTKDFVKDKAVMGFIGSLLRRDGLDSCLVHMCVWPSQCGLIFKKN